MQMWVGLSVAKPNIIFAPFQMNPLCFVLLRSLRDFCGVFWSFLCQLDMNRPGKMSDMKRKLILLIAFLFLPLSGCGIIAIGYNYADAYLRYSVNSYASFNAAQKEVIKHEVDAYMLWHRKNMLPEYVRFLQTLQERVQTDAVLKKEEVARFRLRVRTLYIKTLQTAVRPAAKLLGGIAPVQIEELVVSFAKENNKQRSRELGGNTSEQLRKRAERTIDFLESMVGGFSDKQLDKIREMSYKLPFATAIYIAQREDNQAGLIKLLRNNRSEGEIADFLSAWLVTPEANRSIGERNVMLAFESASDEMIANVYQILTDKQRKNLLKNIVKYIDTFQDMAGRS